MKVVRLLIIGAGCLGVAALLFTILFFRNHRRLNEIERRIKSQNVGEPRLRSWAEGLLTEYSQNFAATNFVEVRSSKIPEWVRGIGEPTPFQGCTLTSAKHEIGPCVTLAWY